METKLERVSPEDLGGHTVGASGYQFTGITVGQLLPSQALGCKLLLHYDLGDAASALVASCRTAAAIADEAGHVVGLLTENDLLRAFFEDASPDQKLSDWFGSGLARASDLLLKKLTVRPTTPLTEVAERMVANAVSGGCACRHVLVQEWDGQVRGVLSALDMVQALCRQDLSGITQALGSDVGDRLEKASAGRLVRQLMKSREEVFACSPKETLKDVARVLLMTQQNSALVADEKGIYGIVTPRDVVKAFGDATDGSTSLEEWLVTQPCVGARIIDCEARLLDAAAVMTMQGVSHLVAVRHGTLEAVGTISAFDLAISQTRTQLLRAPPRWTGPSVGDLVGKPGHPTVTCQKHTTLSQAAELLSSSGRTSAALTLSDESAPMRLLTESDLLWAYAFGWEPSQTAENWLLAKLIPRSSHPKHLLVPASMKLTEAACLMMNAGQPGEHCHHLVVKAVKGAGFEGGWLGILSALDVARGLAALRSQLEVAQTGADRLVTEQAMKPLDMVPQVAPGDTLASALKALVEKNQHAALVVERRRTLCEAEGQKEEEEKRQEEKEEDVVHGLVTARCALRALAENRVPESTSMTELLTMPSTSAAPREISSRASLLDAAGMMSAHLWHHLLVVDTEKQSKPIGVLSSLDVARAIASMHEQVPFTSLGWLWAAKGSASCTVW